MEFDLSDDQYALQDGAARLLAVHASPERVRAAIATDGGLDRELWSAMADQGWTAVEVPAGDGGLGLGVVETAVLAEQVGRYAAPVPFVPVVLARWALAGRVADHGPAAELATGLAEGSLLACVFCGPPQGALTAAKGPDGWAVTGRTGPVIGAPEADVAVVVAGLDPAEDAGDRTNSAGDAVFAVVLDDDHRPLVEPAMDRTRSLGQLVFDGRRAVRIGDRHTAAELLDRAAVLASAQLLGGAARSMEMAVDYAKVRHQFGQPIGSFQAVKHRCADMLVDVEGMRSAVYAAAWCVDEGTEDAAVTASSAKAWCSAAGLRVSASSLQVHGGIGFTWEHDLHIYMKRTQLDQWSYGDSGFHLDRLARLLRTRLDAGLAVL
ncbi:MAG: acyl-CoA dehydrogenase family protein [Acidimicrobiales bacterium]